MHLCKGEVHEAVLVELRSLSVKKLMVRMPIMHLQEFRTGTIFVCWGMKVFVEGGSHMKRTPCVNYETQESTTHSYPTTGCVYLPKLKLASLERLLRVQVQRTSCSKTRHGVHRCGGAVQ